MTDFEFIEINDATATPRKVAGEFVTQTPDDLFHQTAIPLHWRLEEGTNVTLSDSTPTVIDLNGMESHVLVDIGGQMDNNVEFKVRYFAGGPLYPAQWVKLTPHDMKGGIRNFDWFPTDFDGYIDTDSETSNNSTGGHVFLIATRGAVELVVTLYGSSVTKTGVDWARLVLGFDPVAHVIAKNTRLVSDGSTNIPTGEASYAADEWLGDSTWLEHDQTTPGSPGPKAAVIIRSLTIGTRSSGTEFGDIDVFIMGSQPGFGGVGDGSAVSASDLFPGDVLGVLQFRASPAEGQYPLISVPNGSIGNAMNVNLPVPRSISPNLNQFAVAAIRTVDAVAAPEVGANGVAIGYVLDWG